MHEKRIHTRMDSTETESRGDISEKWRGYQEDSYKNQQYKITSNPKGKPTISEFQIENNEQLTMQDLTKNLNEVFDKQRHDMEEVLLSHKQELNQLQESNKRNVRSYEYRTKRMQRIEGVNKGGMDPIKRRKSVR